MTWDQSPQPLLAGAGLCGVLASHCPSQPTDALPSPPPPPESAKPPNICLSHSTLGSDTGNIGNIWPEDAESGEMEAIGEKYMKSHL